MMTLSVCTIIKTIYIRAVDSVQNTDDLGIALPISQAITIVFPRKLYFPVYQHFNDCVLAI